MNKVHRILIGEEFIDTKIYDNVINPYNDENLGKICIADEKLVDKAIGKACEAFKITRDLSSYDRSALLKKIASLIDSSKEDLAKTITAESGKPISQAKREVERAVITFTLAAEEALRIKGEVLNVDIDPSTRGYSSKVKRFPIGPISAISPFNFPLNLVAHKIAPAIASGNTVVHKPAHNTPITANKLAEIILKAGAVPGTYNMIQCKRPNSEMLVTDERIKMLTFTGSDEVGWHLKEIAGKKKVSLELGGNAGVVVDSDCDLSWAAKRCAMGAFAYAGQICISVQRIFVVDSVFEAFCKMLIDETKKLKIGDPMLEDTFIGPLIDNDSAKRISTWIEEAIECDAELLLGGKRKGTMMDATILTNVDPKLKIACEEVFGPVVVVEKCSNFFEGIKKVNDSRFGLQAGVFTFDIRKVHAAYKDLEVGGLIVNDFPTFRADNYPYGGVKDSGTGREGVKYAIEEMTELKTLVVNHNT